MSVPVLSFDQVIDRLLTIKQPYFSKYLAVYSVGMAASLPIPPL